MEGLIQGFQIEGAQNGVDSTILRVDFHSKRSDPNMTPKRVDFHSYTFREYGTFALRSSWDLRFVIPILI